MKLLAKAVFSTLFLAHAGAQTFEVASVKSSPPPTPDKFIPRLIRGGPGSADPGSATFQNVDLFSILTMAYDVRPYQLSGPDWLHTANVDIAARVPAGATTAEYRQMLQALLVERFKLTSHRATKAVQGFDLVVAKNGPKLKESGGPAATDDGSLQPSPGAPNPPVGYNGPLSLMLRNCSMQQLATRLSGLLSQPVNDATQLKGNYDVRLQYSLAGLQTDAMSAGPTIFDAIPEQLGLTLVRQKASIEMLVIDRMEKVPTGN